MRNKLREIQKLCQECLASDANNPQWNPTLLSCLAKIECNTARAVEICADDTDPFFLTRPTIKSFKAVKGD